MIRMRLALGVSAGFHAAALAGLILLTRSVPSLAPQPEKRFEIALNQPAAQPEPAKPVEPPPEIIPPVLPEPVQPVTAADVPQAPDPVVPVIAATEPPPPPPPLPPPPKPVVRPKPPPKPVVRRPEPVPQVADLPPQLPAPITAPVAVPAPPSAPQQDIAANYRAMLSGWFESHKRYPNSARENAEQGIAIVHFRVDSAGRILDFGLSQSTGYPDLDQGIADMMRGAQLPPFPPGLTMSSLDVAVRLRFSLTR